MTKRIAKIQVIRKGIKEDVRTTHPKNRTLDSTKNTLKIFGTFKITTDIPE